jgi:hypothetical protein
MSIRSPTVAGVSVVSGGEAAAVGAQDVGVGEQVGVDAVVLVPRGAVAGAQLGDLLAGR